jgi:hypothetical protein
MSSQTTNSLKVFISYSWDSPEHIDRVLALSDRLRSDGIDCSLDQYEVSPPKAGPAGWKDRFRKLTFVLMICTETYCRRLREKKSPVKGMVFGGKAT